MSDTNVGKENNGDCVELVQFNRFYDEDLNTALHYAVAKNDEEKVLEEIGKKYDINFANDMGWTALMVAARYGFPNIVKILIDAGADATTCNRYGASVFDMAVGSGNLAVLHLILQHLLTGGVSRASLESIISPFSISVIFNHRHLVNYLLEQTFDINSAAIDTGISPVMFAAVLRNSEMLQFLISNGANMHAKSFNGESATDVLNRNSTVSPMSVSQLSSRRERRYSPQSTFFTFDRNQIVVRKSSNIETPTYVFTPDVSPIPMACTPQQFFFPPNFSQQNFLVPSNINSSNTISRNQADEDINEDIIPNTTYNLTPIFNHTYIHSTSPMFFVTEYSNQSTEMQ